MAIGTDIKNIYTSGELGDNFLFMEPENVKTSINELDELITKLGRYSEDQKGIFNDFEGITGFRGYNKINRKEDNLFYDLDISNSEKSEQMPEMLKEYPDIIKEELEIFKEKLEAIYESIEYYNSRKVYPEEIENKIKALDVNGEMTDLHLTLDELTTEELEKIFEKLNVNYDNLKKIKGHLNGESDDADVRKAIELICKEDLDKLNDEQKAAYIAAATYFIKEYDADKYEYSSAKSDSMAEKLNLIEPKDPQLYDNEENNYDPVIIEDNNTGNTTNPTEENNNNESSEQKNSSNNSSNSSDTVITTGASGGNVSTSSQPSVSYRKTSPSSSYVGTSSTSVPDKVITVSEAKTQSTQTNNSTSNNSNNSTDTTKSNTQSTETTSKTENTKSNSSNEESTNTTDSTKSNSSNTESTNTTVNTPTSENTTTQETQSKEPEKQVEYVQLAGNSSNESSVNASNPAEVEPTQVADKPNIEIVEDNDTSPKVDSYTLVSSINSVRTPNGNKVVIPGEKIKQTITSKPNMTVPAATGISAAAAVGLGTAAFMKRKDNNQNDEDENKFFDYQEYEQDDPNEDILTKDELLQSLNEN